MSENYKLLKILMSEKDLANMLKIDCEILTFNTDYFEKRLEFFIKNVCDCNYYEKLKGNEEWKNSYECNLIEGRN